MRYSIFMYLCGSHNSHNISLFEIFIWHDENSLTNSCNLHIWNTSIFQTIFLSLVVLSLLISNNKILWLELAWKQNCVCRVSAKLNVKSNIDQWIKCPYCIYLVLFSVDKNSHQTYKTWQPFLLISLQISSMKFSKNQKRHSLQRCRFAFHMPKNTLKTWRKKQRKNLPIVWKQLKG